MGASCGEKYEKDENQFAKSGPKLNCRSATIDWRTGKYYHGKQVARSVSAILRDTTDATIANHTRKQPKEPPRF